MSWEKKEFAVTETSAQADSFAGGGKSRNGAYFSKYFEFPLSITISLILYVHSYTSQRTDDGAIKAPDPEGRPHHNMRRKRS
jgi:hypothetical protein